MRAKAHGVLTQHINTILTRCTTRHSRENVSYWTVHKNQHGGSRPLHLYYTKKMPFCQWHFDCFFRLLPLGSRGIVATLITMIRGSTILARSKHGRLYGGYPPCLLYHTHWGKAIGLVHSGRVMAQTWQNLWVR